MVCADYEAFIECQLEVEHTYEVCASVQFSRFSGLVTIDFCVFLLCLPNSAHFLQPNNMYRMIFIPGYGQMDTYDRNERGK